MSEDVKAARKPQPQDGGTLANPENRVTSEADDWKRRLRLCKSLTFHLTGFKAGP